MRLTPFTTFWPWCEHGEVPDLTYPLRLRGSSLRLATGAGYIAGPWHVLVESRVIGWGQPTFDAAVRRVATWRMHRDAGLRVAADTEAAVGLTVMMSIGIGVLRLPATCEVVAVVDEPREWGFAYGTTNSHPERGEEAFVLQWLDDDTVVGTVAAFSQPARWYTRAAGPVGQIAQRVAARRYLSAMGPRG